MAEERLRIIERDGDVVRAIGGGVEVIAELHRIGDELVVERLSIDGAGPGTLGIAQLRKMARWFAQDQGAKRLRVRGTVRTTGASPGKLPREIVIDVPASGPLE
jgi:hypothetical protein